MSAQSKDSSSRRPFARPLVLVPAGLFALLLAFVLISEWAGWPFLAGPMESTLSKVLDRKVHFDQGAEAGVAAGKTFDDESHKAAGVKIHLFGGVEVSSQRITIAAPQWSDGAPLLLAEDASLRLRYADLWRASRGEQVVVRKIEAKRLEASLERKADGRASWQFGEKKKPDSEPALLPIIEELRVVAGQIVLDDEQLDSQAEASFSLIDGSASGDSPAALKLDAGGRYRSLPFKLKAQSSGVLELAGPSSANANVRVELQGSIGHAHVKFDGSVLGIPSLSEVKGRFSLSGRSLASVGDVIGVTLPTTGSFTSNGFLAKNGEQWSVKVDSAKIGDSQLNAALRFDPSLSRPLLEGRVGGPRLLLKDLGPVIGTTPQVELTEPAKPARTTAPGRVLPARDFDLPSLRAMDANVLLDFQKLDLGTPRLEPLTPMRAHLLLQDGVLTIKDIDARTASGSVAGMLSLDGRETSAIWNSDIRWQDIRLEQWLNLARSDGGPPYITGRLDGQAKLQGRGRSTAQILASMQGSMRSRVRDGSVSHLLVEGAGIDLAQALGVWVKGDESLPMSCALAELQVNKGIMQSKVMVIDTRDSIIYVDGGISLVDESLDLRAVTSPKDFSPLSLRTPILVRGTLASPAVSLAPAPLAGKVIAAGLLSLLNPLAALLPLIDTGSAGETSSQGCAGLAAKAAEHRKKQPEKS